MRIGLSHRDERFEDRIRVLAERLRALQDGQRGTAAGSAAIWMRQRF